MFHKQHTSRRHGGASTSGVKRSVKSTEDMFCVRNSTTTTSPPQTTSEWIIRGKRYPMYHPISGQPLRTQIRLHPRPLGAQSKDGTAAAAVHLSPLVSEHHLVSSRNWETQHDKNINPNKIKKNVTKSVILPSTAKPIALRQPTTLRRDTTTDAWLPVAEEEGIFSFSPASNFRPCQLDFAAVTPLPTTTVLQKDDQNDVAHQCDVSTTLSKVITLADSFTAITVPNSAVAADEPPVCWAPPMIELNCFTPIPPNYFDLVAVQPFDCLNKQDDEIIDIVDTPTQDSRRTTKTLARGNGCRARQQQPHPDESLPRKKRLQSHQRRHHHYHCDKRARLLEKYTDTEEDDVYVPEKLVLRYIRDVEDGDIPTKVPRRKKHDNMMDHIQNPICSI